MVEMEMLTAASMKQRNIMVDPAAPALSGLTLERKERVEGIITA
jgi:hypothetical protein